MAEMIPVGNSAQPINPLQSLSGILGIQQQRQNLQTGALQQQAVGAESQQAQQKNQELQALAQFTSNAIKDPKYRTADGSLDVNKFQQDATTVAPVYGPPNIGQITSNAKEAVAARQALQNLSADQNTMITNGLKGLANIPGGATRSDLLNWKDQVEANNADPQFRRAIDNALLSMQPDANGGYSGSAAKMAAALGGISMQAPGQIDLGGKVQPVTTTTLGPNVGQVTTIGGAQSKTLSPQVIQQPITGAPAIVGGGTGTTPRPIGGTGWQPYAGQSADIGTFQNEVHSVRAAGDQAPLAHNINQQILRLADNAKTGPGTEVWQHAVGALGAPFGLSPSANYQELGKFLEKNAINNMQAMGGPPSDARLSAAAAANGSTTFSPEALKTVTKFNDATNTGLMKYRQAIDNSIGTANRDYTKLPAVKAAWAKNFDVDIFRAENAVANGDTQELAKIRAERGPEGLKQLAQKRANLNAIQQGQLPQ